MSTTDSNAFSNSVHPHQFGPTPRWESIPQVLIDRCRWCVWKARPREGKPGKFDKIPFNAVDNAISTTKPGAWLSHAVARDLYLGCPGEFNGVGVLVETETGLVFGDIDGELVWRDDWPPTYVERSPSGTGLRAVWDCAEGVSRDVTKPAELYSGHAARFVTITGWVPSVPEFQRVQQVNGELQAWVDAVAPRGEGVAGIEVGGSQPDWQWQGDAEMPVVSSVGERGQRSEKVYGLVAGFLKQRRTPEDVFRILVNSAASWAYYLEKRGGDAQRALAFAWQDVCRVASQVPVVDLPVVVMQGLNDQGQAVPVATATEPVGVEVFDLKLVFPVADALLLDKAFQAMRLTVYGGQDYTWNPNRGCYERQQRDWLRLVVTRFITQCTNEDGHRGNPTLPLVSGVVNYIRAHVPTIPSGTAPCWMPGVDGPDPGKVILFRNGILDVETRRFIPPAPELFAINALPHDYLEDAPVPARWMQFLAELWPTRPESRDLLQEMMGSIIAGDMRYQKLMVLIGPPRAGKGTIGRLLKTMVGIWNISSTSINEIGVSGSAESLIGKRLWLMADTKVSGKDQARGLEMLLSVTGQDPISIPRKYIEHWDGILDCQPVMMANSMPKFYEPTGALAARLLPLGFHETFAGREDRALDAKLLAEMSGILVWALDGYDRLKAQGRYTVTQDELEMREDFDKITNPLTGFLQDVVEPAPGYRLPSKRLWRAWDIYRKEHGIELGKTQTQFFSMLKEATRTRSVQRMVDGKRARQWEGLRFRGDVIDLQLHELDAEILHNDDPEDEK